MAESRYKGMVLHEGLDELELAIKSARDKILAHRIYRTLGTAEDVAIFMQHHVFAVWDFMSLLKNLQQQLTCTAVPWTPGGPATSRRLINEIVLVEESDELGDGYISHFELYVSGMRQAGADVKPVTEFIRYLESGVRVTEALAMSGVPRAAADFVGATWEIISTAPLHGQAATFAFGREDLIPDMFERVMANEQDLDKLATFRDYLSRHIEVDAEEHTPMAMHMLVDLCGDDETKWKECADVLNIALAARLALWEAIAAAIETARSQS
jgi:hypothetical protein